MATNEKKETICFNSFYDPQEVEPTNTNIEFVNDDELGYDEHGQVVVIEKPKRNLQAEIQSYELDSLLSEQLKRIANGTQQPLPENYADISEMPSDAITLMQAQKANAAKIADLEKQLGTIKASDVLKANDEELNKIIADYVKAKMETSKTSKTSEIGEIEK